MFISQEHFTTSQQEHNGEPPIILLAINNPMDQRLIRQYLPEEFDITVQDTTINGQPFDICILDDKSVKANWELLRKRKEQAAPEFLPILLLSKNKEQTRNNPDILKFVDDVVEIPVSTEVLKSRLQLLIRTRRYSMKLREQNRQLEQNNEQLRIFEQAINATNAGMVITDAREEDDPIVFCNKGFENLTGYSEEEILGQNCRFLQNDDTEQDPVDDIRSMIQNKEKGQVRLRNYRKDGTLFWNDLKISPIKDESGRITHFVGVQHDVTELMSIRELLEDQKEQYKLLAENSTDMISCHTADGTCLYVSPASEHLLGYTPEELLTESIFDLIHPDDREKVEKSFLSTIEKANRFATRIETVNYRLKTKSEGYRWVETTSKTTWGAYQGEVIEIQAGTRDISERVEYQQQLEEERNLFQKLAESSPVGITIVDKDGQISFANKQAEEILGISKDEISGRTYDDPKWEITDLDGDPFPEEKLPFHQVYTSGEPVYDVQHAIEWPDGRRKLLSINAVPLVNNKDNIQGVIATLIDITEKKKKQKQLEETNEKLKTAQKIAQLGYWTHDIENNISDWSEEVYNIWEVNPDTFTPNFENFLETIHPEDRDKILKNADEAFPGQDFHDSEHRIITPEGNVKWILQRITLHRDEEGNPKLMEGIAQDITDKKEREQKLRESEQRWEELVKKNPSLIQITNRDGTIQYVNPAGANMYGFEDTSELIGMPYNNFISFENEQLMNERVSRLLQKDDTLPPVTYKIKNHEGREGFIELQSLPIEQEKETVILTIGKDVTEHYQYEKKLKQSLDEKETLLQEIHHRVKNNLAIVSGLLELQGQEIEDSELREILSNSQMRIQSIAKVHELLYQHEELNRIDFQAYIRQLTDTMDQVSSGQKHNITYEYELEPVMLNIDQAIPCGMVINELITNSIKHAFGDQPSGTISLHMSESEQKVFIKISDDGMGLPDSYHFMDQKTLGTTIVKMLVQQLKADFKFYNNETSGSSFELSFEKRGYSGPAKQVE